MDFLDAIRAKALLAVMEGDDLEYVYRRICRWYSRTFHTPLAEVEELPMECVLEHYFEAGYEELSPAKRKQTAIEISETPEEKKARLKKEKTKSDDAFAKRIALRAAKDEAEAATRRRLADEQVRKHVEDLSKQDMVGPPKPPPMPDFSVRFDHNLEDGPSIPEPPPRKR